MAPTIIAFDLYGTILSTDSIVKALAGLFGDETAKIIATQARRYQLEYTWRINSMGESYSERFAAKQARGHYLLMNIGDGVSRHVSVV